MAAVPRRGEVWWADLAPARGHEQSGKRPVLVVSADVFNAGPAGLVIVVPGTRSDRRIPIHVAIEPPDGGVAARTILLCDAVRSIATERLQGQALGAVAPATLRAVEERLRVLMLL